MRVAPHSEDTFKALRMLKRGAEWEHIKAWLDENLAQTKRELFAETEPMAMNRLVGELKTISLLIDEVENSPINEASYANRNSPQEIGSAI